MEETLRSHRDPVVSTKLIVGLFFTIAGVLMTADNLDLFDAGRALRWWPAVILLVGVLKLWDPDRRMTGMILTIIGALLLAGNLGLWQLSLGTLWPLLMIAGGVVLVARALGIRAGAGLVREGGGDVWGILGVRKVAETSKDYRGGRIAAVMGGVELDLTEADIAQSPAIVECFARWGGIEIFVPDGWDVIGEVVPVMGGFEVRTAAAADPQKQLIVRGLAFMGGMEIKRRKQ